MISQTNSKKVLIPVEIRARELAAKLFLASVLAGRGYDVYLGNRIQHTALDKIDPDVYFEGGARQHEDRFRRLSESGIKTLVLETEGQAFGGAEKFSERIDPETLEYTDCYCAWGTVAKDAVKKNAPESRVEITGNPRFDLVQKPHRMIYDQQANQLTEQYGEFILFNTNFSPTNGEQPIKEIDASFSENHPVWGQIKDDLKVQTKIFGEFLRLIAETAEAFPNRNVVVRPHPGEDPSFYENSFYAHDNVHIEKRFEARPWIVAATAVVHNSCTTGITSALLDTPVIAYLPDGLEISKTPNEISDRCETITEVCRSLNEYMYDAKPFVLDSSTKSEIKKYIDNIDYLSSERIADVVDSVTVDDAERTSLSVDNMLHFRRAVVRTVGSETFEELWVKKFRGDSHHKFPYLSSTEVESVVDQFADEIKPAGLQINRLPYIVNGFRIRSDQ